MGIEWGGKWQDRLRSAVLIYKPFSWSTTSNHKAALQAYHFFDINDGLFLPDLIDISLHPDIGLDEDVHDRDTEADMNFDGSTSIDYSLHRDPLEQRYLDRSADVDQ